LYAGKHQGARGFYVSAYGRYANGQVDYTDQYESVENKTYRMPYSSSLHGVGGGLMFGAQWLLARRITLDWYIIGAHYGSMKGDITAATDLSHMSQAEQAGLEEDLEHFVKLGNRYQLEATVDDRGVSATTDAPFVGIRGFGLNFGIAF